MSASDLPRTFGPYSLLKLLARGGMGEIYLARSTGISSFEKYYAVKKLLKKFTKDQDVGARFIDEAKLGARLQHPNIVQVFDLGQFNEELYMATEFVDGFDLRRVLRFCHEKKKRIPLDIALFIVREILSGLAYAHRQLDAEGNSINLIHRDISPQNVLVSFEGEVKIIDFGLAKSTQRSQETQANVLLGNFGYMSPEQARGQKLDVRTDVYSTGIVLFELVTRTKRFVDENPLRLLEMVARPTPVMPSDRAPDIPRLVDEIYTKATAPARDDRYATAEAFREEVMLALHKINPRCSREHLAQFLNHLFLGGQAPPAPDTDALSNKSVAVQVQELYQQAEAFRRTKEQDVQDRRLSHFAEDAPQTGSHALMRACRGGDSLTHGELTGETEVPDAVRRRSAAPPASSAEAQTAPVADPEAMPVEQTESIAASSAAALTPPAALPISDDVAQAPTSVYETPSWPDAGPLDEIPMDEVEALDEMPPPVPPTQAEADAFQALDEAPALPVPPPEIDVFATLPEEDMPPGVTRSDVFAAPRVQALDPASRPPVAPPVEEAPAAARAVVSSIRGPSSSTRDVEREEPTVVVDMSEMPMPESAPDEDALGSEPDAAAFKESQDSLIIDFDVGGAEEPDEATMRLPPAPAAPPAAAGAPAARPSAPVRPAASVRPAAQPAGPRPKMKPAIDVDATRKRPR